MVGQDEAEGDLPRRSSGLQCVVQAKELDQANPLVTGRHCSVIKAKASTACHTLQAGRSGKPQGAAGVAGNREAR